MIGQKLGSYRIEAELGSGAMGVVYRGVQRGQEQAGGRQGDLDRADGQGEGAFRAVRPRGRDPRAVPPPQHRPLHGPGAVRAAQYYYAMEYITGPTLDDGLRERGQPSPGGSMVALGVQLCDALHYAHENKGIVHRDPQALQPDVHRDAGQLKLTDFGIAKDPGRHRPDRHGADPGHGHLHGPRADPRHARRSATRPTSTRWGPSSITCLTGVPPFIGLDRAGVDARPHQRGAQVGPATRSRRSPRRSTTWSSTLMSQEPPGPPLGRPGRGPDPPATSSTKCDRPEDDQDGLAREGVGRPPCPPGPRPWTTTTRRSRDGPKPSGSKKKPAE